MLDNNSKKKSLVKACQEIVNEIRQKNHSEIQIHKIINRTSKKFGLDCLPKRSMILASIPEAERENFKKILRRKAVRTASGIAVIAVMSKPHPCPHGSCLYCPGGYKLSTPQSYTGQEPAALRGTQNSFDSYKQTSSRISQLKAIGHNVDKVEIIIMGGTFLSYPIRYQREFVKGCYDALNKKQSRNLKEAMEWAEKASVKNVGMTFETRPDFCKEKHVDLMLSYGATRVEIGVQALDNEIYGLIHRGHYLDDVRNAFRIAKDAGLKVVAHMMPGLPGSNFEKDLGYFQDLFYNDHYKPDMLKIYPTLVIESSELYKWYREGKYHPYDENTTIELLSKIKEFVPRWVRIMRIQRDIPAKLIVAGVKKSNLRELIIKELLKKGKKCKCIRCREIGIKQIKENLLVKKENIELIKEIYESSGGTDIFMSYEDTINDVLISFIRLRIPSERAHRPEIPLGSACLIRELHVYGPLVPIGQKDKDGWQHRGFGAKLIQEAERITKEEFNIKKILIMSAVGTREYYQNLNYKLEGPYMVKNLIAN